MAAGSPPPGVLSSAGRGVRAYHAVMRHLLVGLLGAALLAAPSRAAEPAPPPPPPPSAPAPPPAGSPRDETAWLGIVFGDALDGGVQIVAVVPGGPADRGGVREGDVLLAVGERATPDRAALQDIVRMLRPGEAVRARLIRGGRVAAADVRPLAWNRRDLPMLEFKIPDSSWPMRAPEGSRIPFAAFESVRIPRELREHYGAPAESGVLVTRVEPGGPAARAGLAVADVVVRVAGHPVEDPLDVVRGLARASAATVALDVVRGRKTMTLELEARGPAAAIQEAERRRLEAEQMRLRHELERVEAEMERLRKLER